MSDIKQINSKKEKIEKNIKYSVSKWMKYKTNKIDTNSSDVRFWKLILSLQ